MIRTNPTPETAAPAALSDFSDLGLPRSLRDAVSAAGYHEPTPIQRQAIPTVAGGRDVLGCAQTGTGKTAAFALPILQRLLAEPRAERGGDPRALVLAPTRELAAQIAESFERYGARSGLRTAVVFGGVPKGRQQRTLRRGVDVLVATPGRLMDLMQDRSVRLDRVGIFVLDEADRMLDMGFIRDVQRIARAIPKKRQTLLFSATMPREIEELARRLLVEPARIAVDPIASTGEPIAQSVYFVETPRKVDLLIELLGRGDVDRALVFTRTKRGADRVAKKLAAARVDAAAIHGNKSQNARERALDGFKRGRVRVVVATDIAARGIDVKGLSHVVNYELPMDPESYVHRVGRTGRAGESGVAISFCASEERPRLAAIERLSRKRIDRTDLPRGFAPGRPAPTREAPRPRGGAGRRPRPDARTRGAGSRRSGRRRSRA